MSFKMRSKFVDASNILNQIALDLIVSIEARKHFKEMGDGLTKNVQVRIGLNRMCLFQIILALNKYMEFYGNYKDTIPAKFQDESRSLFQKIKQKEINKFRNKFVGHIINNDTKRPLSKEEYDHFANKILGKNPEAFLKWIYDAGNNSFPNTVVAIVETMRDEIMGANKIDKSDFA